MDMMSQRKAVTVKVSDSIWKKKKNNKGVNSVHLLWTTQGLDSSNIPSTFTLVEQPIGPSSWMEQRRLFVAYNSLRM